MKPILRFIFFVISVFILVNCARTGRPEGGPKDENPPLFVTANPPYKTINFDDKEIKLNFNEFIKLKNINKQLIVSPPLKNPLLISPQGSASKSLTLKILDTLKNFSPHILLIGHVFNIDEKVFSYCIYDYNLKYYLGLIENIKIARQGWSER